MPAAPKILNGFGDIRITEVFGKIKPKNPPEADCHIGIAGKIKVDLQSIGENTDPRTGKRQRRKIFTEQFFGQRPCKIGKNRFFEKTDTKPHRAARRFLHGAGTLVDLFTNVAVTDNRAGNELREHRHIQKHFVKLGLHLHLAAVHVDHISERLKSIKRNANRQRKPQKRNGNVEQAVGVGRKKVKIFKQPQRRQRQHNGKRQKQAGFARGAIFFDKQPGEEIDRRG